MAISTYAELVTAVQNWTHRSSLDTTRIGEAIVNAENRIRKEIRCREMESDVSVSLVSGTRTANLPTGYVGMRQLYLNTDPIQSLTYVTPEQYWATYMSSQTGQPVAYTIEAGTFVFGPIPDSAYTAKALIHALTALASGVTTLFSNHPELYLYASLVEIAPYLGNTSRLPEWEGLYLRARETVMRSDRRDRHGAGVLTMRSESAGP